MVIPNRSAPAPTGTVRAYVPFDLDVQDILPPIEPPFQDDLHLPEVHTQVSTY